MSNSYISFYLKAYRIHVFTDTLRAIDSPKRICFLVDKDIKHLAITPYHMRDLKSHSVPKISSGQKAVVFDLTYAEKIKDTKNGQANE